MTCRKNGHYLFFMPVHLFEWAMNDLAACLINDIRVNGLKKLQ